MCIIYTVLSISFFRLHQSSFFQVKMVNHCDGHVIVWDIEYQIQESIVHCFIHNSLYEIFIKLRSILDPLAIIYSKFLRHCSSINCSSNYLDPNIENMTIIYFYQNLSCICYYLWHMDK